MHVVVDFEIAPRRGAINITGEYDHLFWGHFGAADTRHSSNDGYVAALHSGRDVGFSINGFHAPPTISAEGRFSLLSGYFASAAGDGNVVTFTAYRNDHVSGIITVTLDSANTFIAFDRHFAHIDSLTIEGAAGSVAMDDLEVHIPNPPAAAHVPAHELHPAAHDSFADRGVWHSEPFLF